MATNTATGTIVSHDRSHGSAWVGYNTDSVGYAGSKYNEYNTYVLKFTTPSFIGVSESVTISLMLVKGSGETATVRYAICSSDENRNSYCNTHEAVSDANQIVSGVLSFTGLSSSGSHEKMTINTTGIQPNATYYLILWASTQISAPQHIAIARLDMTTPSVVLDYNVGIIYIGNGTEFEAYECYVGNGTSWDRCIPYIGDGTEWVICG